MVLRRHLSVMVGFCCAFASAQSLAQNPALDLIQPAHAWDYAGQAEAVDGDNVRINGVNLRLEGYDAPDRNGPGYMYYAAATNVMRAITQEPLLCRDTGGRSHNRPVVVCQTARSGHDVGALVVQAGYGVDWPKYSGGRYAGHEQAARKAKRGIWQTLTYSWR